jgi:hypothetical protein
MSEASAILDGMLEARLEGEPRAWLSDALRDVGEGLPEPQFAKSFSVASRFVPRVDLKPDAAELAGAEAVLAGWNLECWSLLETVRIRMLLARPDLEAATFALALENLFRFADEGEACALYRALALLPGGPRFASRAAEGCRTNMRTLFEAAACDTPYPAQHFGEVAWQQLVIKAVFIGAPLWRVHGLDEHLSPELSRMALDLVEERRSAGRAIQPQLWLCLGSYGGERALRYLEEELASEEPIFRRAAVLGLARAGRWRRLRELQAHEIDPYVTETLEAAMNGACDQRAFRPLEQWSP